MKRNFESFSASLCKYAFNFSIGWSILKNQNPLLGIRSGFEMRIIFQFHKEHLHGLQLDALFSVHPTSLFLIYFDSLR